MIDTTAPVFFSWLDSSLGELLCISLVFRPSLIFRCGLCLKKKFYLLSFTSQCTNNTSNIKVDDQGVALAVVIVVDSEEEETVAVVAEAEVALDKMDQTITDR